MQTTLKGIFIFGLLVFFFLASLNADAATITAANCSQSAVQSAVTSAASGDFVSIPSGSCVWATGVTINKGISVMGSSQSSTIITSNAPALFYINGNGSGSYRVSNMTFRGNSSGGADVTINGAWTSMRIDHITWETTTSHSIYLGRQILNDIVIRGINRPHEKVLIDHITSNFSGSGSHTFLRIDGRGYKAWLEDTGFGTDNFVFVEDSIFNYTNSSANQPTVDSEGGGRYVFRHNTVNNGYVAQHDPNTAMYRGTRAVEIYNNVFTKTVKGSGPAIDSTRGGTGVIWGNTIRGYGGLYTWPMVYRAYYPSPGAGSYCGTSRIKKVCEDWIGHCSISKRPCYSTSDCGAAGGTCPTIDVRPEDLSCSTNADCLDKNGNQLACMQVDGLGRGGSEVAGWPCRDQTGRGKENPTTGQQASEPIYWWDNTVDGTQNKTMSVGGQYADYIQEGRDYCNHSPATQCGLKSAWTYTPYPYPHPLQNGEVPPPESDDVKPPSNFRIAK